MKTYWGNRCIAPRIFSLGSRWRWLVSFTSWPLYSRSRNTRDSLDGRLGGPQTRSGCGGKEKKFQYCPCRVWNTGRPAHSMVPVLTELPRHVNLLEKNMSTRKTNEVRSTGNKFMDVNIGTLNCECNRKTEPQSVSLSAGYKWFSGVSNFKQMWTL
jgi:hypothetical protein